MSASGAMTSGGVQYSYLTVLSWIRFRPTATWRALRYMASYDDDRDEGDDGATAGVDPAFALSLLRTMLPTCIMFLETLC